MSFLWGIAAGLSGQMSSSVGKLPPQNTHLPSTRTRTVLEGSVPGGFSRCGVGSRLGVILRLSTRCPISRLEILFPTYTRIRIAMVPRITAVRMGLTVRAHATTQIRMSNPQQAPQGSK